jgi:tetratricopeptide (TPR) repeat protein
VEALPAKATVRIRQQRWSEAGVALEEAVVLARAMPYPYAEARALCTYGELLTGLGQLERAYDRYTEALGILHSLGEVPYVERIERALAEISRR